ncbi:hypothetical protein EMIHUDRAFT_243123 [Emiliania huxleyi CCMP1516]|uniref:ATPase AAA-type core domain-containing protein n=2 Tax=Emiliania huxleyi TaxID=2903 RepID=A0A0D3J6U2_EMIH1|nr:hypothetical protein EMIHUDRAFT_243123 [Emiliania huxleyi CCMP1516]EOD19227.1 hypothetical protein EMIHUDRAFT_243123 [Emiliania huxleyi CCMP1516]|eukprot:XP_005771656.1 hypothetical protein EMIHUDRAFT_243123 [Emiliania huxleyi CCMP1516]
MEEDEGSAEAEVRAVYTVPAEHGGVQHSPRGFGELLSDERLNRQVLRWVKQWDGHVFGRGAATPLLLLSGPPGMGKTALVHVVARHAGYRLLEINASDDRSAKAARGQRSGAQL